MPELKYGVRNGKLFYFLFATILVLAINVMLNLRLSHKKLFKLNRTDILITAFFSFLVLRQAFESIPEISSPDFLQWVLMAAVYGLIRSSFSPGSMINTNTIIIVILFSGIYQCINGLGELYGYKESYHPVFAVTGSFFNPGPFAGFLATIFPVALIVIKKLNGKQFIQVGIRYLGIITLLLILIIIPSTQSRASWLAIVISTFLSYTLIYRVPTIFNFYFRTKTKRILSTIIVIILTGAISFGLFQWKKDSAMGRILTWEVSLKLIANNPLIGVGFGQYNAAFGSEQANLFRFEADNWQKAQVAGKGEYAFNEWLAIGVEQGVLGLFLFTGILVSALFAFRNFRTYTPRDILSIAALSGLVSIVVFSLFSYPFSVTPILFYYFVYIGIISSQDNTTIISFEITRGIRSVGSIILLIFLLAALFQTHTYYHAYRGWKRASELKLYGNYESSIVLFDKHFDVLKENGEFLFEYGQSLTLANDYREGIRILKLASLHASDPYLYNSLGNCYQELKEYDNARAAYEHAFYLVPHKFYPRYLLAKLYEEMGEQKKAVETAKLLLKMREKIPSLAIDEMKIEMEELINKYKSE
ncbi:MAG: O-antigen ligase family protein [Cytophagales bacterium]|nr:O-antigen ligase family protein [Cytophagales bacterium]